MNFSDDLDPQMLQEAVLRSQIEALVIEYAYRLDRGDFPGLLELFTEDCAVYSPQAPFHQPRWQCHRGKAELAASYALPAWDNPHRKMRHIVSNVRLSPRSATEVQGTVAVTGFREESPGPALAAPMMVGDYEDVYRKDPGRPWRIAMRKVHILFLSDALIADRLPEQWRQETP